MDLYVVNELSPEDAGPTDDELGRILNALQKQLVEDWGPAYERLPPTIQRADKESDVPPKAALMVLLLSATEAGALGYHTITPGGRVYSPVFWGAIRDNGGTIMSGPNSLSVTMSHEALELATNPLVSLWCDRPNGMDEEPHEACDRVEGDAYDVDGVALSNFLYPHAFQDDEPGPYDKLGLLTSREAMTPGGYVALRAGGPAGTYRQEFGSRMPDWKRTMKSVPHAASRAARRAP